MITRDSILDAHERIKPFIHKTPVLTCRAIDEMCGNQLFFKCENFQKVGAFKARGAMNAALSLSKEELDKGVATHSSGNHAQALARAARTLGVPSYIVMPRTAPAIKKTGVLGYGGQVFECEPTLAAREETLAQVVERTGATEIHPFDNEKVIEGQATASKELFSEINDLHFIITPVGGGGLLSGTSLSAKFFSPATRVLAAEPEGADDAFRSMQSGKIEPSQANTVADGLLTNLSLRTFGIIREHVQEVITVSDAEIIAAMRLIWERMKIIVEPSGAVPLAAILKRGELKGKKIGLILSGGNIDLQKIAKLFSS
ncbi:MAG TPA: pyridoxal-phosphate dependent enzyme [Chitinophagaceae bacterium]|nr:pyridoxal-phosphate dependent enzyme [Chitinophagaceae bacterium]